MRNVAQTAFLMAVLTLISKLLGFIREMIMAGYYGTSYITDAYVMATSIPSILFTGIFVALSTAYMPMLSRIRERNSIREGDKFTSEIISSIFGLSIIVAILGFLFSDQIVTIFANGFKGDTAELTSFYIKVTFLYVFFTSATGILSAYLQYKEIFLPQIAAGFIQNIGVITVIIISAYTSHYYLAFGMLLGMAASFIIIAFIAKQKGYRYEKSKPFNNSIKEILKLALPVFIGSSVMQIGMFIDKALASGLPEGSVSALNYSVLLIRLATSFTSGIIVTIIYPKITKAYSLQEYGTLNDIVGRGIIVINMIAVPCALGAMFYSNQVVQLVYERGAFDPVATALTASAFYFYAIGLPFIALNGLFTNIYYSIQDVKTPIIFAGISVIIDIVLNLILIKTMAHNGLALATSISEIINCLLLYLGLRVKYPYITLIQSKSKLLRVLALSIISVTVSILLYNFVILPSAHIFTFKIIQLGVAVGFAMIVYLILLKLFKIEEVGLLKQIFKK